MWGFLVLILDAALIDIVNCCGWGMLGSLYTWADYLVNGNITDAQAWELYTQINAGLNGCIDCPEAKAMDGVVPHGAPMAPMRRRRTPFDPKPHAVIDAVQAQARDPKVRALLDQVHANLSNPDVRAGFERALQRVKVDLVR